MKYSLAIEAIGADVFDSLRLAQEGIAKVGKLAPKASDPQLNAALTDMYQNMFQDKITNNPRYRDTVAGGFRKRYWVAEIVGFDPKFKYERKFLPHQKDFSQSNSTGSRGIMLYYILESGKFYEVSAPLTWSKTDRYYCTVNDKGELVRINDGDVNEWLTKKNKVAQ